MDKGDVECDCCKTKVIEWWFLDLLQKPSGTHYSVHICNQCKFSLQLTMNVILEEALRKRINKNV